MFPSVKNHIYKIEYSTFFKKKFTFSLFIKQGYSYVKNHTSFRKSDKNTQIEHLQNPIQNPVYLVVSRFKAIFVIQTLTITNVHLSDKKYLIFTLKMEIKENLTPTNLRQIFDEEWKEIPYTDFKYKVSNYGRIKSFCYKCHPQGKIIKHGNIKGYKSVNLKIEGEKKTLLIHKLVAEMFLPKENDSFDVVIHKDWNKLNNHVSNLEWCTRQISFDRSKPKLIKGRKKRGRIVTNSKLCESDVSAIKDMLANGRKQKIIAQLFCVSEMQISRIKNKVSWTEV